MAKRGRPKIEWTPQQIEQIEAMAIAQCRNKTIAKALDIDDETFRRHFETLCAQKRAEGKATVLQAQYKTAAGGNVVSGIWWGKQYLEQKDRADVTSDDRAVLSLHDILTGVRNDSPDRDE